MVLAVAAALTTNARAGECGWATAGKVLTGVIAGAAIVQALQPPPTYVYTAPPVVYVPAPAPVVYAPPPPVVYAPAPVVYAPRPVVVCGPPVYVRPAPMVSFHYSHGHGAHHGGHGCR